MRSEQLAADRVIATGFYRIVGLASALGALTVLVMPALTPQAHLVAALWLLFSAVALGMSTQSWAAQPSAVLGLSIVMSLEVMAVAFIQGWSIEGAGLPFLLIPLFAVAVLCRRSDALALYGLSLMGVLALFVLGEGGPWQADALHPAKLTRLAGLLMALTMCGALGLTLGHTLSAVMRQRQGLFMRYRSLFNQVPAAVVLHRGDQVIDANDRAVELFGAEGRNSAIARPLSSRLAPASRSDFATRCVELDQRSGPGVAADLVYTLVNEKGQEIAVRAAIARSSEEEDGLLLTIFSDERERQQLEISLRHAKEAAEAVARAKSSFLANTSHEIRTPLNGIIGLLQMVRDPQTDEPTRQRYLSMMAEGAESLRALLTDVLDLSKIEADKLVINREPLHLGRLLSTVADTHRVLAEAKGLNFLFHCELEAGLTVMGDAQRLRQVLVNLLSNSLKFTSQGMIRLSVTRRADGLTLFEVEDTGVGVAEEAKSRLFEPFTQADGQTNRIYGGTGLGLSICRRLVEMQGGRMGLFSRKGLGSRFWFELPMPLQDGSAATARLGSTERTGPRGSEPQAQESVETTLAAGLALSPAAAPEAAPEQDVLHGRRILVADDNPVNLLITSYQLERHGAITTTVNSGERAVAAAAQARANSHPFDLILMDVQMPEMDGYEATRRLKVVLGTQTCPIVALTAGTTQQEVQDALNAGMQAVLSKPMVEEELLRVAEQLMQAAQADSTLK